MKFADMAWRGMTDFDLDAVVNIAAEVHPGFHETREVLAERYHLYRPGSHILEIGSRIAGYVISHPWRYGNLPALNSLLGALPEAPDTYYLHDIALLPLARRIGAAGDIVGALAKHAEAGGYATMSLVAVNGSQRFWERHGFGAVDLKELGAKLSSYEPSARYMVRPL